MPAPRRRVPTNRRRWPEPERRFFHPAIRPPLRGRLGVGHNQRSARFPGREGRGCLGPMAQDVQRFQEHEALRDGKRLCWAPDSKNFGDRPDNPS